MISRFFIFRPILATVISLVIMLAGILSIRTLPIAQFPDIIPPQVGVQTSYPGASAEVIAQTVAAPLEQSINGVDSMLYVSSTSSSSGDVMLSVTFAPGTDPDQNTINVNNRVQTALNTLPEEVRRQGVTVTKQSANLLLVITLDSPDGRYDEVYMSNYALVNIIDELKRLPGVGEAMVFGARDYSMRVWLRPDKLAQLGLTPADVAEAIQEQNSQFAAGSIGGTPQDSPVQLTYKVTTQGRLVTPEEFGDIILRTGTDGSVLRVKDVARIELGAVNYSVESKLSASPAVAIGVFLSSGANALATGEAVTAKMQELSEKFPDGIVQKIPYDTTAYVRVSIHEVVKTLFEAMGLVFLIIFLFLQDWRATLIPCLAVPVSIVGAFAGMKVLGFSINTLTLFGLVLAIGIVVDDAIVVIENVERVMRTEKKPARDATLRAMQEVTGPVIAIVLVLCAVFVPVGFMGGLAGEMYRQFAVTIAVSVTISGVVALTLTPALCALLMRPHVEPPRALRWFNTAFDRLTAVYSTGVRFLLRRVALALALFVALGLCAVAMFRAVPSALLPQEDTGFVISVAILPDGSSLSRTAETMQVLDQGIRGLESVKSTISLSGYDLLSNGVRDNVGTFFIDLKEWDQRPTEQLSAFATVGNIFGLGYPVLDAMVLAFNPPPIMGMGDTGGFEGYIQSRGEDTPAQMSQVVDEFVAKASGMPELGSLATTFSVNSPQVYVKLDRAKAKTLGVPITRVFDTMQATFGEYYVNDFNKMGRTFKVKLQSESDYRRTPENLGDVYVRSDSGEMIPLTALATVEQTTGPYVFERFNVFPAAKIYGAAAPGCSSGDALEAMERAAREFLPANYSLAWTGTAYQEKVTSGSSVQMLLLSLLVVFLILAAQYEKWTLPLAVILVVPFALFGAAGANLLRGLSNDIYFQVALVTLIGLSAKNAILIVEFAELKRREEGLDPYQAAMEAARLRFRPIIMTSMAFVLGCLPLAISTGAGANSRHSIGTGVIGGMLAATFIATFFIPAFYKLVITFTERLRSLTGYGKAHQRHE